jgi:hypothetical protein
MPLLVYPTTNPNIYHRDTAARCQSGPCLVPQKFLKIFQILRYIESLDVCMEY